MHTDLTDISDAADRLSRLFFQNAGICLVGFVPHGEMMRHHGGVETGGNLCGAGNLGAVTDNARDIGKRVVNRLLDLLRRAAGKVGDCRSGRTGGGDGTAECRQLTDKFFLVDGQQA